MIISARILLTPAIRKLIKPRLFIADISHDLFSRGIKLSYPFITVFMDCQNSLMTLGFKRILCCANFSASFRIIC